MPRPLALLDVDHTLLFDDRLNLNLVNSLKSQNIKDIFLFTDMRLTSSVVKDRMSLVSALREQGFVVHGVITPPDLFWSSIPQNEAKNFNSHVLEHGPKKLSGEEFHIFLEQLKEEKYKFAKTYTYLNINHIDYGICYREGELAFNESFPEGKPDGAPMPNDMNARSQIAKMLGDQLAWNRGYSHTKGLLLEAFIAKKPSWVSSIIIADDNEDVIKSISEYKNITDTVLPVNAVRINDENFDCQDAIADFTSQDKRFLDMSRIVQNIDKEIKRLHRSRFNFFMVSPKAKIQALKILKNDLLEAGSDKSINDILEEWQNKEKFKDHSGNLISIRQVISQKRNVFSSQSSMNGDFARSRLFVNKLKNDNVQQEESGKEDSLIL